MASSRAGACAQRVGSGLTRKMTIAESMRLVAWPEAMTLAHCALRDVGRRMDDATRSDVDRACEGVIEWACAEGRVSTISDVLRELESRLKDLESTLAAGFRGREFDAPSPSGSRPDDVTANMFHSVKAMKDRSEIRQTVIEEWLRSLLDKLEPEENLVSVIKPKLLLRAYDILSDRIEVNDESVENMVNSRFDKWMELWREHASLKRKETGKVPDHAAFVEFMRSLLTVRLPAFANGVNKSSFRVRNIQHTDLEKASKEAGVEIRHPTASKHNVEMNEELEKAVKAIRAAEKVKDVQALLATAWVRSALVDAPKFVLPPSRPANTIDNAAQMMKDWQREEGFLLRFAASAKIGSRENVQEGFENLSVNPWNESYVATGPFRVHFMRACSEIETALLTCKTCTEHNIGVDDVREACNKGAARIMLVASRTLRSGDGLEFVHNLFGMPPAYTVSLVDPGRTKKLIQEHSTLGAPIVIEITPAGVNVRCVDIFVITRHYFADEVKKMKSSGKYDAQEDVNGEMFEPWACVALETTQTLRVVNGGMLRLVKQRIAVDKLLRQPVLDIWLSKFADADILASEASGDERRSTSVTISNSAYA